MTCRPSFTWKRTRQAVLRQTTARIWASVSFSVKYTWPEPCRLKFDTSPPTHTTGNASSTSRRKFAVRSLTLSTFTPGGRAISCIGLTPPGVGSVGSRPFKQPEAEQLRHLFERKILVNTVLES